MPIAPSAFVQQTLANGATLIVKERPTAGALALSLAVLAGARDESPDEYGVHNLLTRAHLLGAGPWPTEDALRRAVAKTGGGIGASASRELIQFSLTVPAEEFELAADVLRAVLLDPRFDPDAMARDKRLVLQEIVRLQRDPNSLAFDTLVEAVANGHPAGHSALGTTETVAALTRDQVVARRDRVMVGGAMTLAVVGQVDVARAESTFGAILGAVPSGAPPDRPDVPMPPPLTPQRVTRHAGQRQAQALIGVPTPGRRDPDRYALLVLDAVLGSASGRLFAEIRTKRGLAYSAGAGLSFLNDAGVFFTSAGADPSNVELVIELMQAELQRVVDEPLDDATLRAAVGQLAGRRVMSEETSSAHAGQIASLTALGAYESPADFTAALRRVTAADVLAAARRVFTTGHWIVTVLPVEPADSDSRPSGVE
ncbi:MAG: insulinase family protein [Dehalococcoidia bacterium]|nr:insulinase family protein [Dehalococcoidia bacterium]